MMSKADTNFYFDADKMECVLKYKFSRRIDFYSTIIPLSCCLAISIFTVIRCYDLFRRFPEEMTKALLSEIKFYPLIFILCNATSFMEIIMKFQQKNISETVFVLDQLSKGLQGALICLVFFWKRMKFRIIGLDEIISGKSMVSKPTEEDFREIERVH